MIFVFRLSSENGVKLYLKIQQFVYFRKYRFFIMLRNNLTSKLESAWLRRFIIMQKYYQHMNAW